MTAAARQVVFVDSRVADYQILIAELEEGSEWFLFNPGKDGIRQMESILSGYTDLDTIQLISHGSAGTLYLGSTVLDSGNLSGYQTSLQVIGASLSETGDILNALNLTPNTHKSIGRLRSRLRARRAQGKVGIPLIWM